MRGHQTLRERARIGGGTTASAPANSPQTIDSRIQLPVVGEVSNLTALIGAGALALLLVVGLGGAAAQEEGFRIQDL